MKKYLLLSLLALGSTLYPMSCKSLLWSLVSPVRSMDSETESLLLFWQGMQRVFGNEYSTTLEYNVDPFKKVYEWLNLFPENDPTTKDRLAKALLLARHGRLIKIGMVAKGIGEAPDQTFPHDYDYEAMWQQQPRCDRFWWTIRYRRPYTYVASLGKWGTEIVIVGGCIYALHKLKKWYKNRTK